MMLKDIDYRSYIAGVLTGLLFLVIAVGTMATLRRDLSGLRRRQPQPLGCQYERRVTFELLQGIAGQLEISAEDLWGELNAGKTFPELFAEQAMQQQEALQQESGAGVGEGMETGTAAEEGTGEATGMGGGAAGAGGEVPGSAAAATGS